MSAALRSPPQIEPASAALLSDPLDFFFAERHRTQSNFRIETTLQLRNVELPPTAALYD
jgi:hypothetical protein